VFSIDAYIPISSLDSLNKPLSTNDHNQRINIMSDHPVYRAVSELRKDEAKVLHLTFKSRRVKVGDKVPKRGEFDWWRGTYIFLEAVYQRCITPWLLPVLTWWYVSSEAKEAPTLTWTNAVPSQKYLVACLDLDAPFPSFAPLGPVLHWLQTGFTINAGTTDLTSSDPEIAYYAGPGPPPISSPHRYVFTLYEQPAEFDGKTFIKSAGYGIRDRMRYDFARFETEAKLGPAVAGTYFLSNWASGVGWGMVSLT
jgi:phosphatidylethanolamine-binding protein